MKEKVFTNGCFDIVHIGHIRLLEFAKSCGDYLVVGINSDESIKRLKGEGRPIIWEQHRKEIIQSIRWVDDVIIFQDSTPYNLIKMIQPKVLVKGEDWKNKKVVGSDLVEQVKFFPFVQGISSTHIVERL